jgi:NADPH:quinone reductase-like Zn-dependent oxidoreductase/NADP-dependent 3-hydroxy acid dehydrogenase YdfG
VTAQSDGARAELVVISVDHHEGGAPDETRAALTGVLDALTHGLADETLRDSVFVVRTTGAVAALPGDRADNLAAAAVWGLVRSAQAEEPGRIVLVDAVDEEAVLDVVATGEPQVAVRGDRLLVPRARRMHAMPTPPERDWRLTAGNGGSLDDLAAVARPGDSLAAGQVRVAVRANGLNFRDAMLALGMYPGRADLGTEGAGVVLAVGDGVTRLGPGDRVMGLITGIGPVAETDQRLLTPIPAGLSFAQAAAIPAAFLTAVYALRDLAGVRAGETVLVHSAAGGVGGAAVQLARHWGVRVFGTASPGKWSAVRAAGLPPEAVASSRDLSFAGAVSRFTGGAGVDVVLNSLAGEFVDTSLTLLREGGRFVEMGKTDVRDPDQVRREHSVRYRAFDLAEAGPDRIAQMLAELAELFDAGVLAPPPVTGWPASRAPEALRYLSQARQIGKVVLTMPRPIDPDGTVVITGVPGGIGNLVAKHLVQVHGARHLLLLSRRGSDPALAEELADLGASARFVAVDVADGDALAAALAEADRPLTAVVHAAGVLDDATLRGLTPDRLDAVLRPKVAGAWHLHRLTEGADLAAFVLFSSAAGLVGSAGQAAYAAANTFLDALAAMRGRAGLPATSIAWGLWQSDSAMTGSLSEVDRARMARSGLLPIAPATGLRALDAAIAADVPALVAVRLDLARLARVPDVPAPLRALVDAAGTRTATRSAAADLPARLAGAGPEHGRELVLGAVRTTIRAVLGQGAVLAEGDPTFKELGFDSLTSVELRNRLGKATGLRLPATIVFDHPTPASLAEHLLHRLAPREVAVPHQAARPDAATDTATDTATDDVPEDADALLEFIDAQFRS